MRSFRCDVWRRWFVYSHVYWDCSTGQLLRCHLPQVWTRQREGWWCLRYILYLFTTVSCVCGVDADTLLSLRMLCNLPSCYSTFLLKSVLDSSLWKRARSTRMFNTVRRMTPNSHMNIFLGNPTYGQKIRALRSSSPTPHLWGTSVLQMPRWQVRTCQRGIWARQLLHGCG